MKNRTGILFPFIIPALLILTLLCGCKKSDNDKTPEGTGNTVTDVDGNVYPTVTIGGQVWMAANLRTTHYRNHQPVTPVSDSAQWAGLTTPGYCMYNNDAALAAVYGYLYNWYAVTDTNNLAPSGWHVPTDADWVALENALGSTAGGAMKTTGTTQWNSPNTGATNSSGFSGIPGGDRSYNGSYHYMGQYACWWSTTENTTATAWEHVAKYNSSSILRMNYSKNLGLSVRCVKDIPLHHPF